MAEDLKTGYDDISDVFYLSIGAPDPRARSSSDEHGLVWRTSTDGRCTGVTVQRFTRWIPKIAELEKLLARNLHLSKKSVRERIPEIA